jgi:hypothetical protein
LSRKRRRSRGGKGKSGGGGALGALRGGFRSVARGATGVGRQPAGSNTPSRGGAVGKNLVMVILIVVAAFFLLRRFGILRW